MNNKKCEKCGNNKKGTYAKICRKCYSIDYCNKNKDIIRDKRKIYNLKNKERIREVTKDYRTNNKEKIRKRHKLWWQNYYSKNRDRINKKTVEYHKIRRRLGKEKQSEEQRIENNIRRKTRGHYPLKDQICEICKIKPATERHHTTKPLEYNKFIFVCHLCHMKLEEANFVLRGVI